jgi:O-antigen/teichoic acid export membrane protein
LIFLRFPVFPLKDGRCLSANLEIKELAGKYDFEKTEGCRPATMIPHLIFRKINGLIADKKFSEILTGSIWALSARLIATGLGLVSTIIIARFYGAETMGVVAVIDAFLLLATIFTLLGTNTSILRLIPEHLVKHSPLSAFKIYRKTKYLVIAVSLVTGTLFFFGAELISDQMFSKPHLSPYFALAAIFIVFKSLMLLNTAAVRGLRLIRFFALMQILPQGFNLLLLLILGMFISTTDVPVYAMLGGFALTGVVGWVIIELAFRKIIQPQDQHHHMSVGEVLSISLPMLMTAAMTFVVGQTGVIMLGMFRSESEVGYYAIAVKLATLTSFILSAINSMAAPKFSELFHSGKLDELFYVARKSAKLIFWTTAPILFAFVALGKTILYIAYGQEFTVAYSALVLLVIGQFVHSVSGATGLFMNMTGNQKVLRNIMLVTAVLNIILCYLLIPGFGTEGAAIAATVCLCTWNIATLVYIKIKYRKTTGYLPGAAWL